MFNSNYFSPYMVGAPQTPYNASNAPAQQQNTQLNVFAYVNGLEGAKAFFVPPNGRGNAWDGDWIWVILLLALTACSYDCDKLSVDCYHNLLDGTLCYKQRTCKHGENVGELAERYKGKRLIIRINGHLTCSLYGTIVDIWDCTEKTADVFWIVE